MIECANLSGSSSRRVPGPTPVVTQPTAKIRPTPTQNASSARLLSRYVDVPVSCVYLTQKLESLNESNAVLPNSTDRTARSPGAARVVSRFARGLRMTSTPSRRPHTESLATRLE